MAKVSKTFTAKLELNPEKGGGWLATYTLQEGGVETGSKTSAWKNASAGKKWVKAMVQATTPRKSVKLNSTATNEAGKPTAFAGVLTYKE